MNKKNILKYLLYIILPILFFSLLFKNYINNEQIKKTNNQIEQEKQQVENCYNLMTKKNLNILELEKEIEEKDKIIQNNNLKIEELESKNKQLTNENNNLKKKLNNQTTKSNTGILTKSKGVNYFNGHKETWYSQKVLPGKGLKIPGRHVATDGTIRDANNYIVVASSDLPYGTIVETSLGTGKVYDSGCDSGIIDIYTNW